ncbi:hypothetical protein [Pelagicoccus sp. SDUM812002]|uniref:hypothetical protein n=1 Tax=Pelagicoccus sp. SDUM812002 TaxID=3041266 RepID=UPI00280F88DC|nr:hypothetical protein [Pelagicoccus sp. SDUM812002]MDQ8187434.1 hypothetical protein [Pelagicoccus sp. SDUM812002]
MRNLSKSIVLILSLALAACSSTREWNPFVDRARHDTIAVLNFQSADSQVGRILADQIASELIRKGEFSQVLRSVPTEPALILAGTVTTYKKGNVPLRIKTKGRAGHATITLSLTLSESPSGYQATQINLRQTTQLFGPDASRTGRESIDWLQQQIARQVAKEL